MRNIFAILFFLCLIIEGCDKKEERIESPYRKFLEKDKMVNRLKDEKSPYLLQHADNPVDWFAWKGEAFEKAKREDKPIFLSIGYSTCHWCHVMEHESFEDEEVAAILNKHFISIKVDREERPDVDNIYMTVCQAITGRGGWPLSLFLTPDKKPFFAGTYIPKEHFIELLNQIVALWRNQRENVILSSEKITKQLFEEFGNFEKVEIDKGLFDKTIKSFKESFDRDFGGFGIAPKFPAPHNLLLLLRLWKLTGDQMLLQMVEKTLKKMRLGGIYDHIGFGFHRYSTDQKWFVPHFEKMLYDQALLIIAYAEVFQITKNKFYEQTTKEVISYVLREMTSREGGFYSAEDADSEGKEGKFYLWTKDEIIEILGAEQGETFSKIFGVKEAGNFEEESSREKNGTNILHLTEEIPDDRTKEIKHWREKLFEVRNKRVHPLKDDKVLTDWNGLMIAALAKASQIFDNSSYNEPAVRAVDFILNKMRRKDGRLLHMWREGEADIPAFLDDYAFLVWGLIELYEATFDTKFLKEAITLSDEMIRLFYDDKKGGFFHTANDSEQLIARIKDGYDGAIPSGNAIACFNLLRLARITMNKAFEEKAIKTIEYFSHQINSYPLAFTQFVSVLDFLKNPVYDIVIVGNRKHKETYDMLSAMRSVFLPNKIVIVRFLDDSSIETISPFVKNLPLVNNKTTAYVCENYSCKLPTNDVKELLKILKGGGL